MWELSFVKVNFMRAEIFEWKFLQELNSVSVNFLSAELSKYECSESLTENFECEFY